MITILYADDEEVLLQVGKVFLERNKDYSVDTVTSATKALGMMDTKHYDAVISDYQMPGMDGIAFLHEVRNRGNVVPFILFTGKGREEIVIQALNEGADFYLQKGGDPQSQFAELSHKVQLAVEKRRAEARIRDHERREADIINFLPDATFAIDAAGTVIAWNRAMEEMTGIPAAEMLGRGNYEYSLPLYRERRPILIDRILDPGPGFEEYPTIQRHGDQLTAEINLPHMNDGRGMQIWLVASPLYDREGKIVGAIESVRDVTSRIRSEKVLQDAETKFASVFENNPIPLTLVTADDGAFSNVNAAFLKNTGYELDQVIGKTPWDLGLFVIREEYERLAGELRSKGYVNGMEVQCRPKAGGIQYCSFSSCIVTIAGRPHILSTIENITARRAVEDALRESEEKYRDLFDSITDAIFVHHLNREKSGAGTFIEVNDPACRMLGYTRDELLALTPLDISVPDTVDVIPGIMKRHLDGEDVNFSTYLVRKDGTRFPAEIHTHVFILGGVHSVISIVHDITMRRKADEALRQANRQLLTMTQITRHDICNGILASLAFLELAKKEPLSFEGADYLEKVGAVIRTIQSQITFTRVYQDLGSHEPQWISLAAIADGLVAPEPITLKATLGRFEVYADAMLAKVFSNLLDNSIRHGGQLTEVRLAAREADGALSIVWEDNGTGIPQEEKEAIFERGYGRNTGLGLFLVREILGMTGISIHEEGIQGKGARFVITVPAGTWRQG